jgi:predicted metalloprotease
LTEALKWQKPSEEELKKFLVEEKGFSVARVEGGLKRINVRSLNQHGFVEKGSKWVPAKNRELLHKKPKGCFVFSFKGR